jgi:cell division transport system ATP-binding protein
MNLLPQSGLISFDGFDSKKIRQKDLPFLRRKIGIVFQDFRLLEDRNVYENLAFVLQVTGTPKKEIKKRVYNVLSDLGLSHKQKNMPHQLSGGEKQRIAIARSILNNPMLILADEPTGNLDPETQNEIVEILKKINRNGTAVIFATHNYSIVKKGDSRIIKLADGKAANVKIKSAHVN